MTIEQLHQEHEALEKEYAMLKRNTCDVAGHVAYARRLLDHVQRSLQRMEQNLDGGEAAGIAPDLQ